MSVDFISALAFYPAYGPQGMVSQVVYVGATATVDVTINTLLKQACRQFALDKRALANAAHFISGKRNLVPLTLCVDRTFVPLKVHVPRVSGDSAYGYFLLQGITSITATENGSEIHLAGGLTKLLLQNRRTAMGHIARAALFEKVFWSKRLGPSYISGLFTR